MLVASAVAEMILLRLYFKHFRMVLFAANVVVVGAAVVVVSFDAEEPTAKANSTMKPRVMLWWTVMSP